MKNYLVKYFREKTLEFKESSNNQFLLKICPACGDDAFHHFYLNWDLGLWDCKKCGNAGNFNQFRKFFGDSEIDLSQFGVDLEKVKPKEYRSLSYQIPLQYAARLWSIDEKFAKYLTDKRKLNKDILEKFKIGSDGKQISIPIYENDTLVNIRYRRDPDSEEGPKYTQESGCKATLFNGDVLKEPLKTVFITEGEFDALQLLQRGFRNVVSITLGAGYFSQEWVDKFSTVQQVYICFDTDEAGRAGAKRAAEKIGFEKCKMIVLPHKEARGKTDITDYFVEDGFTKTDFLELVKKAVPIRSIEEDSIKHISEFNERLRKNLIDGEHLGEKTGYALLDEVVGGLRKGRLIILSGLTSSGKTSLALNICLNMADRKLPCFYFSLEMPPIDIAKKVLMLKAKLTNDDLKDVKEPSPVLEKIDATLSAFKEGEGLPIYLYNGSGVVKYEVLSECARLVKERYNAQIIFVDHLHYFAQNYNNLTAETSQMVRKIKQLAIQLDMPIVLLAHLNRGGRATKRKGLYIPSLSDLRDSGATEQDADQVLFVCRDSENEEKDERQKAFIKIAKNRDGYAGRSVSMIFDETITTFIEEPKGVDYETEIKEAEEVKKSEVKSDEIPF